MTQHGSINRDLETLAHSAALSLRVPFVTIAVNAEARQDEGIPAGAVFADSAWAAAHRDLDLVGLDNASAVAQNIPFYACVPVRNVSGEAVGRVCCGGSEERGLTDAELGLLKSAAADVAALLQGKSAPAFARA